MVDRVRYIPCNALLVEWPKDQDTILFSSLFSGVPGEEVPRLVKYDFDCLAPSGTFMVHNFMVKDDRTRTPMSAFGSFSIWPSHQMPIL